MVIVYYGIRPFGQTRHRGLLGAYAARWPVIYVDPMNVRKADAETRPVPGPAGLPPNFDRPGLYRARLAWFLPGGRFHVISLLHRWLAMRSLLRAIARKAGAEPVVFVVQQPDFLPTLRGLGADLTVYEVRDDYVALTLNPLARERMRKAHRRMLASCDLVLGVSDRLVEDIRALRPDVIRINTGVDDLFFEDVDPSGAPHALHTLPRPCVGTIGNLNDRVDWELLARIALLHPEWSVAIVGPLYHADDATKMEAARVARLPNVSMPGGVQEDEIPAAIASMDVCLIPYRVTEAVERINPLKLYQYLAGGKPVVCSAIPAVQEFADIVAWTQSDEEFIRSTEAAVAARADPELADARRKIASRYRWQNVVDRLLAIFQATLDRRKAGPGT